MVVQKNQIAFEREPWNQSAAAALLPLVDSGIQNQFIDNVNAGHFCLWRVTGEGVGVWLVTSYDKRENGIELVLEVIAGRGARIVVHELKKRAKKIGIKAIRFETFHAEKIAEKLIGGAGFERFATIFKVAL